MGEFAGIGTTAVFVLAALVWVAYLVPVWLRRREYLATERNAVRLQQTLRIMAETAETPEALQVAADARDIARQQRLLAKEARLEQAIERAKAVARAKEIDDQIKAIERQVKVAVAGSVTRRERLRRTRLACTAMLVASIVVVGVAIAAQLVPLAIVAGVVTVLALVGLGAVNRSSASLRRVSRAVEVAPVVAAAPQPAPRVEREPADFADRSWTPVRVPPQLAGRAPIDVLRDAAMRSVAEGEGERAAVSGPVARVTPIQPATFDELVSGETSEVEQEQPAALPPRSAPALESMGVVEDDVVAIDIGAALRRRRAS